MKLIQADRLFVGVFAAFTFAHASFAQAADCKGLQESACTTSTACTWIKGYQRSDGREVKPYCRTLPKSQRDSRVQADKTKPS